MRPRRLRVSNGTRMAVPSISFGQPRPSRSAARSARCSRAARRGPAEAAGRSRPRRARAMSGAGLRAATGDVAWQRPQGVAATAPGPAQGLPPRVRLQRSAHPVPVMWSSTAAVAGAALAWASAPYQSAPRCSFRPSFHSAPLPPMAPPVTVSRRPVVRWRHPAHPARPGHPSARNATWRHAAASHPTSVHRFSSPRRSGAVSAAGQTQRRQSDERSDDRRPGPA